jgi:hypothetical protein
MPVGAFPWAPSPPLRGYCDLAPLRRGFFLPRSVTGGHQIAAAPWYAAPWYIASLANREGSGECHTDRRTRRDWGLRASSKSCSSGLLERWSRSHRAASLSMPITIIFGSDGSAGTRRSASPLHPGQALPRRLIARYGRVMAPTIPQGRPQMPSKKGTWQMRKPWPSPCADPAEHVDRPHAELAHVAERHRLSAASRAIP